MNLSTSQGCLHTFGDTYLDLLRKINICSYAELFPTLALLITLPKFPILTLSPFNGKFVNSHSMTKPYQVPNTMCVSYMLLGREQVGF
jgi:hypothetical protein